MTVQAKMAPKIIERAEPVAEEEDWGAQASEHRSKSVEPDVTEEAQAPFWERAYDLAASNMSIAESTSPERREEDVVRSDDVAERCQGVTDFARSQEEAKVDVEQQLCAAEVLAELHELACEPDCSEIQPEQARTPALART